MLDTLSPLQIGAYGTMGALTTLSLYRTAAAFDCLVILGRQRKPAKKFLRALALVDDIQRAEKVDNVLEALRRRPPSPISSLVRRLLRHDGHDQAEAAKAQFVDKMKEIVALHRHRLSRLASIAGPMGLGFTVVALIVYLYGLSPEESSVGNGLLQALPVSLGTTAIACFNIVILKVTSSMLAQKAHETMTMGTAAADALLKTSLNPPNRPRRSGVDLKKLMEVE